MNTPAKLALIAIGIAVAFALGRCTVPHPEPAIPPTAPAQASAWTCPMHPQIKLPDPGACPMCGMDLVPLAAGEDEGPRRIAMSPDDVALARIAVVPLERSSATRSVRLVGKVDYDETLVRTISARVPGRIERLYVDYTGVRVHEGDHLVELYSPELLTAQEELLAAKERLEATSGEASRFLAESNAAAYTSARDKLLLYGLDEAQVDEIEARGSASDRVELNSPSTGVVIGKLLDEGAYVETGTPVYKIADLDRLWLRLDAYEQDIAWLRHGQEVAVEVEALPGHTIRGRISYIDPFLRETTRTAKVRVNVDNADGRLKPGMFVRAVASVNLGARGEVLDRHLAGKWVSPMHPEIVKDGPGSCDVCGMDLVPAEVLGLVSSEAPSGALPLVVPATAVLVTGTRAVAYVEVPDAERPTYEGREVVLGPRVGDGYVVLDGLEEGERVVVHGAFRIDSSMQIRAKPSMMSMPADDARNESPESEAFRAQLAPLFAGVVAAQEALAADDEAQARAALLPLVEKLDAIEAGELPQEARERWATLERRFAETIVAAAATSGIEPLREAFWPLSRAVLELAAEFGSGGAATLVEVHCPMAFDNAGASWLQAEGAIANPYFGASMLRCGAVQRVFAATGSGR